MGVSSGRVESPVFGRLFFSLGPFDEQPFQRMGCPNLPVPRSRPNPHGREREDKISLEPSRHGTMRQASSGSLLARVLAETGTCSLSRRMRDGGRPRPLQGLGGSGWRGRPDAQRRLHADHIGQTAGRDAEREHAVGAIPSVGQQDARSDACCQRGSYLSEGDLGFGPEFHFVRDTNLLAPRLVPSPIFRQIQP